MCTTEYGFKISWILKTNVEKQATFLVSMQPSEHHQLQQQESYVTLSQCQHLRQEKRSFMSGCEHRSYSFNTPVPTKCQLEFTDTNTQTCWKNTILRTFHSSSLVHLHLSSNVLYCTSVKDRMSMTALTRPRCCWAACEVQQLIHSSIWTSFWQYLNKCNPFYLICF